MTDNSHEWLNELHGVKNVMKNPSYYGFCGAWCDPGWREIVETADKQMAFIAPNYRIDQIKEKFGTLRYYWSLSYEDVYPRDHDEYELIFSILQAIADRAESLSCSTCEQCGTSNYKDQVTTDGGKGYWIKTLCKNCREARYEYLY